MSKKGVEKRHSETAIFAALYRTTAVRLKFQKNL
jgi:hypothetical protein